MFASIPPRPARPVVATVPAPALPSLDRVILHGVPALPSRPGPARDYTARDLHGIRSTSWRAAFAAHVARLTA